MNDNREMFYGATPPVFEKARVLRKNMTHHEKLLWEELRFKNILGLRFKAQHPIDNFIADFYCHKLRLVIEVDGEYHNTSKKTGYDLARQRIIENYGIRVLRFTNNEIQEGLTKTVNKIRTYAEKRMKELTLKTN